MIASLRVSLNEEALRKRVRNIGHLLTGNAASLVLGIPAIALTARGLGPDGYGILAIVLSYVQAIKRFADFQMWQPIIRYGADLEARTDTARLRALFKFGLMADAGASLAAWSLAVAGASIAHFLFGMGNALFAAMIGYATVLLFNINGTPIAILRLAGRFRAIAYNQLVAGVIKLLLCVVAFRAGGGLAEFVIIWAVTDILAAVLTMGAAFLQLRRQGLHRLYQARARDAIRDFPGIVRFTWSSNLSLTIWSSTQQLDTLLVGWLTNPATAGLYFLAKRIARLTQQASQQVQAVVFPEVARLWSKGNHAAFRRVIFQTEIFIAAFGIAMFLFFAVFGHALITLFVGPQFAAASILLTVQMGALVLAMSGTVMRSALLAMGASGAVLTAVILSTSAFYATALLLIPVLGAMGANVAHIILGITWLTMLSLALRRRLRTLSYQTATED